MVIFMVAMRDAACDRPCKNNQMADSLQICDNLN